MYLKNIEFEGLNIPLSDGINVFTSSAQRACTRLLFELETIGGPWMIVLRSEDNGIVASIVRKWLRDKRPDVLVVEEPEGGARKLHSKDIAEFLLEIAEKGTQIIIFTWDYCLVRWLDLLRREDIDIHYHLLENNDGKWKHAVSVCIENSACFNLLTKRYMDLFDDMIKADFG